MTQSLLTSQTGEENTPENVVGNPLFVDLDRTLVATDTFWESVALLLGKHPLKVLFLPLWLLGGWSRLKRRIADLVVPDATLLPYNETLLRYLERQAEHRKVYLISAAEQRIVEAVGNHLGFFSAAFGSSGGRCLKAEEKLKKIRELVGESPFDYVGNKATDIQLWEESAHADVASSGIFLKKVEKPVRGAVFFYRGVSQLKSLTKALRPHQWVKNTLVFAPFVLAHKPATFVSLILLLLAFISFSLCSSAVYAFNDILDLESDRRHPDKKRRPFAAGQLSPMTGILLSVVLLFLAFSLSLFTLPIAFTAVLLGYLLLTGWYTLQLKKLLVIDALCLSSFYVIRLFAGSKVSDVELSPWLIAFASFFFLNLAYAKRYIELETSTNDKAIAMNGRGYQRLDSPVVLGAGLACGFLSVLIFCLYITSSEIVAKLYSAPDVLWLIPPVLCYWISRIWILAHRREVHSDPVFFAVRDPASWLSGLFVVGIGIFGTLA